MTKTHRWVAVTANRALFCHTPGSNLVILLFDLYECFLCRAMHGRAEIKWILSDLDSLGDTASILILKMVLIF